MATEEGALVGKGVAEVAVAVAWRRRWDQGGSDIEVMSEARQIFS